MSSRSQTRAHLATVDWLLQSDEPWTRYRTLIDLLDRPAGDHEVEYAREEMLAHPAVGALVDGALRWSQTAIKRHNDAAHPLHLLTVLTDFGLRHDDPGMGAIVESIFGHRADEGAFQSLINLPQALGGNGRDGWAWLACDAPVLLHSLLALGLGEDERVRRAADHVVSQCADNGWRCVGARELGRFHGPGRRSDPCPIANLYALRALALLPERADEPAVAAGCEALLGHWERQASEKPYMFGIGGDFRKIKYPFVWYDLLHMLDVLSRFPAARDDPRFAEMLDELVASADHDGRYTAGSMYLAWRGWSFADKKSPSPWLTLLALRVRKRAGRWA